MNQKELTLPQVVRALRKRSVTIAAQTVRDYTRAGLIARPRRGKPPKPDKENPRATVALYPPQVVDEIANMRAVLHAAHNLPEVTRSAVQEAWRTVLIPAVGTFWDFLPLSAARKWLEKAAEIASAQLQFSSEAEQDEWRMVLAQPVYLAQWVAAGSLANFAEFMADVPRDEAAMKKFVFDFTPKIQSWADHPTAPGAMALRLAWLIVVEWFISGALVAAEQVYVKAKKIEAQDFLVQYVGNAVEKKQAQD